LAVISQLITQKNNDQSSGLDAILLSAPKALPYLLKHINYSKTLRAAVLTAFCETNNNGDTGLFTLAKQDANHLVRFIRAVLPEENGLERIINALSTKNKENQTAWQFINEKEPQLKKQILGLITAHLEKMDAADLANMIKNTKDSLDLENHNADQGASFFSGNNIRRLTFRMAQTASHYVEKIAGRTYRYGSLFAAKRPEENIQQLTLCMAQKVSEAQGTSREYKQ